MANLKPWSSGQGSCKGDLDSVLCEPQVSCHQSTLQSQLLFNLLVSIPLLCKTEDSAFFHFWACWAQNYEDNVLHSGKSAQEHEGEKYMNTKDRKAALLLPKMPWTNVFLMFACHFRTSLCSCAGSRHSLQPAEPNRSLSLPFPFPPRAHNTPPHCSRVKISLHPIPSSQLFPCEQRCQVCAMPPISMTNLLTPAQLLLLQAAITKPACVPACRRFIFGSPAKFIQFSCAFKRGIEMPQLREPVSSASNPKLALGDHLMP